MGQCENLFAFIEISLNIRIQSLLNELDKQTVRLLRKINIFENRIIDNKNIPSFEFKIKNLINIGKKDIGNIYNEFDGNFGINDSYSSNELLVNNAVEIDEDQYVTNFFANNFF